MTAVEEQVRLYATAVTVVEPDWVAAAEQALAATLDGSEALATETVDYPTPHRDSSRDRSAWLVAAVVLILVAGAAVLLSTRSGPSRTSPPPLTESVPTVPVTQPASVYPASGDWGLATLSSSTPQGGWIYQLSVPDEQGRRWALVVYTTVPGGPTGGGEHIDVDGKPVLIGDDPVHPSATWEPLPGTTAGLSAPPEVDNRDDAISSADWIIKGLTVDTSDAFHEQVADKIGNALLTLGDTTTALNGVTPANLVDGGTFRGASQLIFVPGHEWGDVYLSVTAPSTGYLPPGAVPTPITIRGVSGMKVAPAAESSDRTSLSWSERGYDYALSFATSISVSDAVELANSLRVADPSESESMLFPDWAPAFPDDQQATPVPTSLALDVATIAGPEEAARLTQGMLEGDWIPVGSSKKPVTGYVNGDLWRAWDEAKRTHPGELITDPRFQFTEDKPGLAVYAVDHTTLIGYWVDGDGLVLLEDLGH